MITEIDSTKCTGCRICVEFCPMDVLRLDMFREEPPPCQAYCPAYVNIRGYLYLLNQGDFNGAMKLLRETLPLPAITGRVCYHPCELECARKEVDEAVSISALERFLADYWLKEKATPLPRLHVARVAIVGSGPAGLAAAYDLIRMGYQVTIFESMTLPGGMLRYGIPEYRLPRNILDAQIAYIKDMGVEFKLGVTVGRDLTLEELKDMGYKAICIAVGTHWDIKLDIHGADLNGVYYGLDFLKNVNMGRKVKAGQKMVVIGGGNVAVDTARTALRLGAQEAIIIYRRSKEEMPAHRGEIEAAENEGVRISYLTAPTSICGKGGTVESIECIKMELDKPDVSGRRSVVPVQGSEFSINTDMVVSAIGEAVDAGFWFDKCGLSIASEGKLKVDQESLTTDVPGVFAGGDAVSGPTSVIEAIASGKRVAISIDGYLRGVELKARKEDEVRVVEKLPGKGIEVWGRQMTQLLPIDQRSRNFSEVRLGFSEEAALREACRCLSCGSKAYIAYPQSCMTCYNCELACPSEAVNVGPFRKVMPDLIRYP